MKNQRSPQKIDAYVGHKLRQIRLTVGISQTELADAAGVSFQQLQKYEEGVNRISIGRLYILAKTLDVPLDYFVEGFENDNKRGKKKHQTQKLIDKMLLDKKTMQLLQFYHQMDDKMRRHIYGILKEMSEKS